MTSINVFLVAAKIIQTIHIRKKSEFFMSN